MSEYTAIIEGICTRPTTRLKSILKWCGGYLNLPVLIGHLKTNQTTATIGLVWWFGGKEGAW
jgi:hypothetical protein